MTRNTSIAHHQRQVRQHLRDRAELLQGRSLHVGNQSFVIGIDQSFMSLYLYPIDGVLVRRHPDLTDITHVAGFLNGLIANAGDAG